MPPEHWIKKISWVETERDGARLCRSHVSLRLALCADFINETVQPWKHVKSSSPVGQTGTESLQVTLAHRPLSTSQTRPDCNKLLQPEDPRGCLHTRTATTTTTTEEEECRATTKTCDTTANRWEQRQQDSWQTVENENKQTGYDQRHKMNTITQNKQQRHARWP